MSKYRTCDRKPSQMFLNAIPSAGATELECGWCGRHHMCPDTKNWGECWFKEDYLKYCQDKFNKNPDGVVLHYNCDGIEAKSFNDMAFVIDCPCNGLTYFEDFLWKDKHAIVGYIRSRDEQEQRWERERLIVEKLRGSNVKQEANQG